MATPQWDKLKAYIYSLPRSDLKAACDFFAVPEAENMARTQSMLGQEAFQYAKRKAAQFTNIAASYDATRHAIHCFVQARRAKPHTTATTPKTDPLDALDIPTIGAPPSAPADMSNYVTKPQFAAFDRAIRSDLNGEIDQRLKAAGALPLAELRAYVAKLVDEKPAMKIEVTSNGASLATFTGTQHKQFATLLRAVSQRQSDGFRPSIWLAGPAGSGKTYAATQIAKALGVSFEYNGALSMAHEVLGYKDASGTYHGTAFRRAYETGAVYLFDEVDACADNSPLMALNAALANGIASFPDTQVQRHSDNVIIAGANTFGLGATADYVGRIKLDAAFLDRFPIKIFWDYDAELEASICGNEKWATRVQRARYNAKQAGLKVIISPRASIAGAALIASGFSFDEAATMTYLGNLSPEQAKIVEGR